MNDRLAVAAQGLVKRYQNGRITALDGLDLEVREGEFVALCGPSGCGKSTLLNFVAAIDRPDAGTLHVLGHSVTAMPEPEANRFRATQIGLIFQLHNLLPHLTAVENVQVPMMMNGLPAGEMRDRACDLLVRVGLEARMDSLPPTLSGGERQRVAIARAVANKPRLLLADEPTGALDSKTGGHVFDLLGELRAERGMTLVVVTHDRDLADRAERVVRLLDGRVVAPS